MHIQRVGDSTAAGVSTQLESVEHTPKGGHNDVKASRCDRGMQKIWDLSQGENGDGKEQMCEGADAPELQVNGINGSDELNKSLPSANELAL